MPYNTPETLIGQVLDGTYEVERIVGEGAFGAVYAAKHRRLGRAVAVKILRAADADAFARFRREAEITSSLGSRFIAQVFDFNHLPTGEPYLVMELLDGEDLAARLARVKTIALAQALKVCEQVASALAVAHKNKIVHRDLKPQNVFLCRSEDEGEVVKVIDFGISKVLSSVTSTAAGQFLGSPLYMSPEQVRGRSDLVDERTDVYALGAVIYEALAGRTAYQAQSVFELVEKISGAEQPPKLSTLNPEVPPALDEVLARAMAKNRDDRPRSVTELYNQISNVIRGATRSESATPAAAIVGTHALETMHITGAVATPLWRGRTGAEDQLRFVAPEGGFYPNDFRTKVLKIPPPRFGLPNPGPQTGPAAAPKTDYFIGSVPVIEGVANDLVLPHRQVSRNAARVVLRDGRVWLRREPKCNVPVRVGLLMLERDEERPLHHGQPIAIGVVAGVFHDGRFVPAQAPAQAVDEQTGLLGREGLAWEIALAARLGDGRRIAIAMPLGLTGADGGEGAACRAALAVHATWPTWPVARFGRVVAVLAPADAELAAVAKCARDAAGGPMSLGHLATGSSGDQAGARIDEACGALERLAATAPPDALARDVIDLGEHALRLVDPGPFVREASAILARGGQAGLLVLDDQSQLRSFGDGVVAALELELLQVAGRIAGATAVLCRPAQGAVAFAGPDAAEPIARQIAMEWHSRGPVRGEVVEVERGVTMTTVGPAELPDLARLAAELVAGGGLGAGVDTLPLPIASRVRAALTATAPADRAEALIGIVAATWRLMAIGLSSMALAGRRDFDLATTAAGVTAAPIAGPWRHVACTAAAALAGTPGRVGELVAALFEGGGPRPALVAATDEAAAISGAASTTSLTRGVDKLEAAVVDLLSALRPLRGWTLVHVDRVDRVDVFGDCETVHYVDYTGTHDRGTPRQVTLVKDLRMGPFAYLARLAEGIVVPLEPHLRQRNDPATDAPGLYWAAAPIGAPGVHRFEHVLTGEPLEDDVTAKQIPRGKR